MKTFKRIIACSSAIAIIISSLLTVSAGTFPDGERGYEQVDALYFDTAPTLDGIIPEAEWGPASVEASNDNAVILSEKSVTDALNETTEKLDISLSSLKEGKKITVYVDAENNPGIWSMMSTLDYNKDALKPVSYTNGEVFADSEIEHSNTNDGTLRLVTFNDDLNSDNTNIGRIISYEFVILDSTLDYGLDLIIDEYDVFNNSYELVPFTVTNTANEPEIGESPIIPGDINGNESVDISDLFALKGALIGSTVLTADQLIAADIAGNSGIDISDYFAIKALLLG